MPLELLVCHCRDCNGRQSLPPDTVLDHAAKRAGGPFTYELLAAMLATHQERDYISTTTLTSSCLRSEALKRSQPYTEDPQRMYASFRGTMFHGQLEQHAHPGAIAEPRYHIELSGLGHFSGSPDLVDVRTGYLYDYKFTKENPRWDKPWDNHVEQCQINRWLVDHADYVEYQGGFYPLNEQGQATVDAFVLEGSVSPDLVSDVTLRENQARFRPVDWQGLVVVYMDDKGSKPLLITRSEDVPKKTGPGTKKARVADIWSDDDVEALVRQRYSEAQDALLGGELPAISEKFAYWQHPLCGFCPVKGQCVERFLREGAFNKQEAEAAGR